MFVHFKESTFEIDLEKHIRILAAVNTMLLKEFQSLY
jgi:hypothetical protein